MVISVSVRECVLTSHNNVLGVVHVEHYTEMQRVDSLYIIHEISNIKKRLHYKKIVHINIRYNGVQSGPKISFLQMIVLV